MYFSGEVQPVNLCGGLQPVYICLCVCVRGGGGDYSLCGISVGGCSLCISAADYSLCMSVGTIARVES